MFLELTQRGCLSLSRGMYMTIIFKKNSFLTPPCRSKSNIMCSLLGKRGHTIIKIGLGHMTKMVTIYFTAMANCVAYVFECGKLLKSYLMGKKLAANDQIDRKNMCFFFLNI